jgi:hypothetical protein
MGHKVRIGALEVEVETLEQVVELSRLLDRDAPKQLVLPQAQGPIQPAIPPAPKGATNSARNSWDRTAAWQFMSSLAGTAKAFMGQLIAVRSINSGEMAKRIAVEPNLLGPAIRSIRSKSQSLGKGFPFEVRPLPGGAGKTYVVTHEFYEAAIQAMPK